MPRRNRPLTREIHTDAKHNNLVVARMINRIMMDGKKATAERIVYDAMDIMEQQEHKSPVALLEQAVRNATPLVEVKPRRVGGATYQVPVEVTPRRGLSLGLRWLTKTSRSRSGRSMAEKLAVELLDAAKGQGPTIKKKEDTHKMAEANRAFAHYKW